MYTCEYLLVFCMHLFPFFSDNFVGHNTGNMQCNTYDPQDPTGHARYATVADI